MDDGHKYQEDDEHNENQEESEVEQDDAIDEDALEEDYISTTLERVKEGDVSRVGKLLRSSRDIFTILGSSNNKNERRRMIADMTDDDKFRWMVKLYAAEYNIPEYITNTILDLEEEKKIRNIKYKSPAALMFALMCFKSDIRGNLVRSNNRNIVEIDIGKFNKTSEKSSIEGVYKVDLVRYCRYLQSII